MQMSEITYNMNLSRFIWQVWYVPKFDEIILFKVDSDDVCTVFRKGGVDSVGFLEFMDFSKAEFLGDL